MANISRDSFNEGRQYDKVILQQGQPLTDYDFNEAQDIQRARLRRMIIELVGNGAVDNGWQIIGTEAVNNFTVTAGVAYVNGYRIRLAVNTLSTAMGVTPTTPVANRTDHVYLDVYETTVNSTTDPNIRHPSLVPAGIDPTQRTQIRADLRIAEGTNIPADTENIFRFPLATINRLAGNNIISAAMVVDTRQRTDVDANIAAFNAHRTAAVLEHPDNSVTDIKIGNRTLNQTITNPTGNTSTLGTILSWFANRIRAITGATNWFDAPATTLLTAHNHHGAAAPHTGHETQAGAQARVDTHANLPTAHTGAISNVVNASAENLIINGTGALRNNTNFSHFTFDGTQAHNAFGSFRRVATGFSGSDGLVSVNPNLRYVAGFSARTAGGASTYLGTIISYDADGFPIEAQHHMYRANTLTTLAQELRNGDTVVRLTNAANWDNSGTAGVNRHLRSIIIWNYTNSLGFQYPALTYSRNWTFDAWNPGAINFATNIITLRVPWAGGTIPIGTQLSNGSSGNAHKYFMDSLTIPTTWTVYTGTIGGIDFSGQNVMNMFPPGTVSASLSLLWASGPADTLWLSNVHMRLDAVTRDLAGRAQVTDGLLNTDIATVGQTATLAGKAGGQTIRGGVNAGETLILDSTAHATKGDVLINPNGGFAQAGGSLRILGDTGNWGVFTVGGTSAQFFPVELRSTSLGQSVSNDIMIYRSDAHMGGLWNGTFSLKVSHHATRGGHLSGSIEKIEYFTGEDAHPYGNPVGDLIDGTTLQNFGDLIVWLRGGAQYEWRTLNSGFWRLVNGNPHGGNITDLGGTVRSPIGSQSTWLATTRRRIYGVSLGLGTAQTLAVDGTGNSYVQGNLGIGTTTPTQRLHVAGTCRLDGLQFGGGAVIADARIQAIINTLMLRDASGRAQVADGLLNADIATVGQVNASIRRQLYTGDETEVNVVGTTAVTRKSNRMVRSTSNGLNITNLHVIAEARVTAGTGFIDIFVNNTLLFTLPPVTSTTFVLIQGSAPVVWTDNSVNVVEMRLRNSGANTTFNRLYEIYV